MTINRFLCLIAIATIFSCVATAQEENVLVVEEEKGSGGSLSFYSVTTSSSAEQEPGKNKWQCGVEYIEEKGPQGESIVLEIPMQCDPLADIYKGDPAPGFNEIGRAHV